MIKYISLAAFTVLLLPALSFGGCIVEMKNGHSFTSSKCWEENGQVMLYLYGGKVGFHKELVKEIRDFSGPVEEKGMADTKTTAQAPGEAASPTDKKKPAPLAAAETVSIDPALEKALKNERAYLSREKKIEAIAFKQAKESEKEDAVKSARRNLFRVERKIKILHNKTKEAYGGKLPAWW